MFHSFDGLPTEVLIQIVDEIIAQNNKDQNLNNKPQCGKLESLGHLMNWSSTSSRFRNLLAPYIFHTVELRNEEKSAASLYAVATGKHACLVKVMNFYGSAPAFDWENYLGVDFWDTIRIFPEPVGDILSNLQYFPCLETLGIEFSITNIGDNFTPEQMTSYPTAESDADVWNLEGTEARRALMAKTYWALANNNDKYVKGLILRDIIHTRVSTFTNPHFHNFLNHIEKFSISLRGGDHDTYRGIHWPREYKTFTSSLDKIIFDHLLHVKSLTIKAPAVGPLGQLYRGSWSQVPLALKKKQMPFLESACFEYVTICPQLIDFLIDHKLTLKNLSLHECFVNIYREEIDRGIYWDYFFDRLCDAQFQKLCHVEILPLDLELCNGACELEEVQSGIHRTCQFVQNPDLGRRLFNYAKLNDSNARFFPSKDEILAAFDRGDDQISYDRLMEKININAANRD